MAQTNLPCEIEHLPKVHSFPLSTVVRTQIVHDPCFHPKFKSQLSLTTTHSLSSANDWAFWIGKLAAWNEDRPIGSEFPDWFSYSRGNR
jgi:hypothetical protein